MEDINEHEIDGLIQTMKETGIKGLMKYTDVLVWNHICERNWCNESNREGQIKFLKQETDMEYNEIMNLLNRYDEWRKYLPSYSLRLNQNLDSINKKINSLVMNGSIRISMNQEIQKHILNTLYQE